GRSTHIALHESQARTPGAGADVTAARAHRKVTRGNGTDLVQFWRVPPDINELLLPQIAPLKREWHARIPVPVGRDIGKRVSGAARITVEIIGTGWWRRRTEFFNIPN